jgi:uncharacterized protein YjbJ (UPF0337 family)
LNAVRIERIALTEYPWFYLSRVSLYPLNEDRLKGALDEVVGTIKRKAGELIHDIPLQAEGIAQQVKGKLENTLGKAKDAVREAAAEAGEDRT